MKPPPTERVQPCPECEYPSARCVASHVEPEPGVGVPNTAEAHLVVLTWRCPQCGHTWQEAEDFT